MKRIVFSLLLIFGLLIFTRINTFACSCLLRITPAAKSEAEARKDEEQNIKGHLVKTDAVFLAKVSDVIFRQALTNDSLSSYEVKLTVRRFWKGQITKEITVFTPDSCFRSIFEIGKEYLIYAEEDEENNKQLWTNMCSGNLSLEQAADVLKVIGKGKKIKAD